MAVKQNAQPLNFRPRGLSDTLDATNSFPGSMAVLTNLIPAPSTKGVFVPRPGSTMLTTFSGFTSPSIVNCLYAVGALAYGVISETSGTYSGLDVPFIYNLMTNTFVAVTIPGGAASLPTSPATTGDWTPPIMSVAGARVMLTHPGYAGASTGFYFGWIDFTSFISTTTGNTHGTTTLDTLGTNVLLAGWSPGQLLSGTNIAANTTIVSIASNGLSLVMSKVATGSTNGVTITASGGTPSAPLYGAGNMNQNPLPAVPLCVANFNGRAYYGGSFGLQFSDSGNALQSTNASQALTPQNGLPVTALAPVPLISTVVGGIIQSLTAFQGTANALQVTGDPVTLNLILNNVGVGVGTVAPNTICSTPLGVAFVAPDGVRFIEQTGAISEPIGFAGDGVSLPFQLALYPSRMVAGYAQNVLRISVQNGLVAGNPWQEYWFDMTQKIWSGPHTFPAIQITAATIANANTFVIAPQAVGASLYRSDALPNLSSNYEENGGVLSWVYKTSLMPDNEGMNANCITEANIVIQLPTDSSINLSCLDESGIQIDNVVLSGESGLSTIWKAFTWGLALWGVNAVLRQTTVPCTQPWVFKQMQIEIVGSSATATAIGNFYASVEPLGYSLAGVA